MFRHNYMVIRLYESDTRAIDVQYLPNSCNFIVINKTTNTIIKPYKRFEPAYNSIKGHA